MDRLPESINFAGEERKVLEYWKKLGVFKNCLRQSKGRPRFTFYDGPPFATGLPHYGHLLTGTIKDIIPRFAHQSGFHVERRFGWDCHGLPVEFEIDKLLGVKGPEDVAKLGIENYNKECRKIVMRYSEEWESTVTRMGRWIDFENDYKTMYPWFMESVWWVFEQLYNQGFIYKGVKVMPYSPTCNTPLSNFEAGQNYKEVVDPAITVTFPLDEDPKVSLVAWTTTPWTLPSNVALCVNPELIYVTVQDTSSGALYIMMKSRLSQVFKTEDAYKILREFKGIELKGKSYKPILPYFEKLKAKGSFRVLCDGYVTSESGTGVVHQAPYFGEDDYRVCLLNGVITKDQDIVCPLDAAGRFVDPVSDFKGLYVKDADKSIIAKLKKDGRLVQAATTKHNYPFCWRSDTPLIYRAIPSWFVRVEHMKERLLASNSETYWVPEFVKEKRFGNWLRDARDWAISRNRYWGTPIPLWISDDGEEMVCVGSIGELEKLSGQKITDIHREFVDKIELPSVRGKGTLKRVPEVFDCWFESGSMPYAQQHYPFENKKEFEDAFPADFIAEGVDQTRGWFYTLMVLSTALFDKPPFKNLICSGLVLASDGQKMSKRKKNYPDPLKVIDTYGADALRLYMINSPIVRAENLRFKEEGVRDVLKDVLLPWYNALRFLLQNIDLFEKNFKTSFVFEEPKGVENTMDKWILSYANSLVTFLKTEMKAYRLYTVVPRLLKFIDNLTNWYVRMNRKRLKGDGGRQDCLQSLQTLFSVIFVLNRLMASFTPFITEFMYQCMKQYVPKNLSQDSIHYMMLPETDESLIDDAVERRVTRMQSVIELGRVLRDRKTLPLKYPLMEVVVIQREREYLDDLRVMENYILEELNVRKLTASSDKQAFGVSMKAEPNIKTLGLRLRGKSKEVGDGIRALSDAEIEAYLKGETLRVRGEELQAGDVQIRVQYSGENLDKYEAHSEGDVLVLLDVQPDEEMMNEGIAREIINRIQKMRKKAHLVPTDPVAVFVSAKPENGDIARMLKSHYDFIKNVLRTPLSVGPADASLELIERGKETIKDSELTITFCLPAGARRREDAKPVPVSSGSKINVSDGISVRYANVEFNGKKGTVPLENPASNSVDTKWLTKLLFDAELSKLNSSKDKPWCPFVNVHVDGRRGVLFLENPIGERRLAYGDLQEAIRTVFKISMFRAIEIFVDDALTLPFRAEHLVNGSNIHVKVIYK
ncbi:isoleucine--tRNA ligase, cytoplasmic [Galendromus occidentalis]|uniref:Isoleucine--tRNA ligase, cytoplasmic n=1 Tax=Galendromus occidentalis TaxID=34638 RepID=A0AAJ6QNY5_9ACAR|nr:isoleucine--tRNA ligase, cytoplasmic [Galendromus occidentalis]